MLKSYAVTIALILLLPATIYPHQTSRKLKVKDVIARFEKLGEHISVSVCHNRKGEVSEFVIYGEEGGKRLGLYQEMKSALDELVPQGFRGKMLGIGGGRLPPMGCCDSFIYTYEKVVIEEVLIHGRRYEITVRVRDENRSNKK